MKIEKVGKEEWPHFLSWAQEERWRVPAGEIELFRKVFAGSFHCLREGTGPLAFLSAVSHGRVGWIGNLLVRPDRRGQGLGTLLFDHGMKILSGAGCDSLWLTASAMGRPLYERRGFRRLDSVVRWRGEGMGIGGGQEREEEFELLLRNDGSVWGEERRALLSPLAGGGRVLGCGGSVALLQAGEKMRILGPWVSPDLCPRENRTLIVSALETAGAGVEIVADVLDSSPLEPLLRSAGFTPVGKTDLMAFGQAVEVNLRPLVAFATLGSMG